MDSDRGGGAVDIGETMNREEIEEYYNGVQQRREADISGRERGKGEMEQTRVDHYGVPEEIESVQHDHPQYPLRPQTIDEQPTQHPTLYELPGTTTWAETATDVPLWVWIALGVGALLILRK